MYLPGQTIAIRDGGMGLPASGDALPLVIGHSSAGTANTLYLSNNQNSLKDTLGQGQAVEQALPLIPLRGGVLVLKTAASTAGTASAVTKTAIGTSTGTITVAGAPYDAYLVKVRIKATGALGVGRFDYTLESANAAPSYSEELTIPAGGTYAIPGTNLTLTFVPGGGPVIFENGDFHTFTCVAPQYTTADLATAITALLLALGSYVIEDVYLTGRSASGAAAATMAAAVATHMTSLESRHRWARAMVDAGNDTGANVVTAFAAFAASRVAIQFGQADITTRNPRAGWATPRFSANFVFAIKGAGGDLSENLGRVASGSLTDIGVSAIVNDENTSQQFIESHKINTLRTHDGQSGFFCTNGYLKSAAGSDFLYWDWGRTLDRACRIVFDAQQKWILRKVRALLDGTKRMDPRDAARIEKEVRAALKSGLMDPANIEGFNGHLSGFRYVVDLSFDIVTPRKFKSSLQLVPLIPIEGIDTEIGFTGSITL